MDPDYVAIPGIMSFGDFLGVAFFSLAFLVLSSVSDPNTTFDHHV